MGDIASVILSTLGDIAESVGPLIASIFQGVVGIFYTAPSGEGGTGSLTFVGVLLLIGLAFGLVFFGLNYVRKLFSGMTKKNN